MDPPLGADDCVAASVLLLNFFHGTECDHSRRTGSSFAWSKYRDSQSDNLVPMEIALRIVYAIEHDERFAAYLLIPLHPERPGPQRSLIMLYTWHTIIMMYR